MKWASQESSRAINAVMTSIADLNELWSEAQRDFMSQLKEYKVFVCYTALRLLFR